MSRAAPETLTVQVPFTIRKRGGRKEIVVPEGTRPDRPRLDKTLLKALARAFRWKKMLETGYFPTVGDLAAYEKIAPTYMTRVMKLTLLAPEIVEQILRGICEFSLAELLESFPEEWEVQKLFFRLLN